jgi:poly(beta-D-mannuronate) lyase
VLNKWTIVAVFLIGGLAGLTPAFALTSPYKQYALAVNESDTRNCGNPPSPIVALDTTSQYRKDDKTRSTVDPEAQARYEAAVGPLREYQQQIVKWTNKFVASGGADKGSAACALTWLDEWAKADALRDLKTNQAQFNRDTTLAALTLAYLQLGGTKLGDGSANTRVVAWLVKRARDSKDYYSSEAKERSRSNNHSYWSALGVAGAAIASNNPELFAWPMTTYQAAVCSATDAGALPYELVRGKRARSYHLFALGPLVMLAEMGASNGNDTYAMCNRALDRIVDFSLRSVDDPKQIETLAKAEQEKFANGAIKGNQVVWLEPYLKREPKADVHGWRRRIEQLRPVKSTALGGDLTLLYH